MSVRGNADTETLSTLSMCGNSNNIFAPDSPAYQQAMSTNNPKLLASFGAMFAYISIMTVILGELPNEVEGVDLTTVRPAEEEVSESTRRKEVHEMKEQLVRVQVLNWLFENVTVKKAIQMTSVQIKDKLEYSSRVAGKAVHLNAAEVARALKHKQIKEHFNTQSMGGTWWWIRKKEKKEG